MKKGWFDIEGVQQGDRTLAEQMRGLKPALAAAPGKTVADFGCAEGLIAFRFAEAGAASVWCCDCNEEVLATAESERAKLPPEIGGKVAFELHNLNQLIRNAEAFPPPRYDIVLALAILHKLQYPGAGVRFMADSCNELCVIRLPGGSSGILRSKHSGMPCDVNRVMPARGFRLQRSEMGPRDERVQIWRRT